MRLTFSITFLRLKSLLTFIIIITDWIWIFIVITNDSTLKSVSLKSIKSLLNLKLNGKDYVKKVRSK